MDTQPKPTSFEDYRERIAAILTLAEAKISETPPADTIELDIARFRMARILTAYHLFAEREVFTPCLFALRDPVHKAQVRAVADECAALSNDFRRWARECHETSVIERWATYRPAAHAMIARIRRHIIAAETQVRRCEALGIATRMCRRAA